MRLQQNYLSPVIGMEVVRFSMFTSDCSSVFQSCSFLGTSNEKQKQRQWSPAGLPSQLVHPCLVHFSSPRRQQREKHKQQKVLFVSAGKQAQVSLKKMQTEFCPICHDSRMSQPGSAERKTGPQEPQEAGLSILPYQRDVWAEFCPIFNFIHFRDWAGRNLNFEPFENLGKMLILGFLFNFAPIKRQVLDFMNLQPFDRLRRFLSLISKIRAITKITNFCPSVALVR
jgi:hypothetical protein